MKTKLLKKVRKRYSIVLVHGNKNPDSIFFEMKYPVFVVYNHREIDSFRKTYKGAYLRLTERIRKDYYHTKKATLQNSFKSKDKKLWWNSI